MVKALRKKIKGTEPGNVLAQQFRDIVLGLGMAESLDLLIDVRLEELDKSGFKYNKGTINAKIKAESMTFPVYVDLLINLLKVDNLNFTTTVKLRKKEVIANSNSLKIKRKEKLS